MASGLVRGLVKTGVLYQVRLPGVRVISVGNIQAGGTGKTPLVAQIAREAALRGIKVAILCRGYASRWESQGGTLSPGEPTPSVSLCGDEPALLHELAPNAFIGVGADRTRAFQKVVAVMGIQPDWVILDDGFQHWKLWRHLDIVALTSTRWGGGFFRDWPWTLRNADLLVWTKGSRAPKSWGTPMVRVRYSLVPQSNRDSESCKNSLCLVTGVGDAAEVKRTVEAAGYEVAEHRVFPDHASYDPIWVQKFVSDSRNAGRLVGVTGKDWVKWREAGVSRDDVIVLEPELVFETGRALWEKALWG